VTEVGELPYFDFLLDLLAANNRGIEKAFGRHVHWGYWADPACALANDDDYAAAAERLTLELCAAAGITDGERVLDAGCGFGGSLALLNERFERMALTGLNIDARQLDRARRLVVARTGNTVRFDEGDACALPYPDESLDRILAVECIFHFPSREQFFREARRTLRPGGTFTLTDFIPARLGLPVARLATEFPALTRFQYFGPCNLRYTIQDYRSLGSRTGFTPLVERDVSRHTLPTYGYLKELVQRSDLPGTIRKSAGAVLNVMRWASRTGLLDYYVLAYSKPAGSH
jgi:SAM-dependent methyltransferase